MGRIRYSQRTAQRKRKERIQKLWWYLIDTLPLLGLFGMGYVILSIVYAIQ